LKDTYRKILRKILLNAYISNQNSSLAFEKILSTLTRRVEVLHIFLKHTNMIYLYIRSFVVKNLPMQIGNRDLSIFVE